MFGWLDKTTESLNHFTEQLQWAVNYDGRPEMLQGLREIGSLIFWMSLLDTAMVSWKRLDDLQYCKILLIYDSFLAVFY